MTQKETFVAAIGRLEKFGWIQGEFGNEESGFCLAGCVYGGIDAPPVARGARAILVKVIGDTNIGAWNDQLGRTKVEVIDALRRSLALAGRA